MRISDWSSDVCSSDLAPCLEALLALMVVFQAVLKHGDAAFQFQILADELLLELLGVDQAKQFFAPFLEVFNHLSNGFPDCFSTFVLLPAVPGLEGDDD